MNVGRKGMEWGYAEGDALENKTVSRFMDVWEKAASSRFRINLWFVKAVSEVIKQQDLSMQGGQGLSPGHFFLWGYADT